MTDIGDHVSKLVDDGLQGLKNEFLDSLHVDIEAEITRFGILGVIKILQYCLSGVLILYMGKFPLFVGLFCR